MDASFFNLNLGLIKIWLAEFNIQLWNAFPAFYHSWTPKTQNH